MSYTYDTKIGDGVTNSFTFSLAGQDEGYLSVSNIHVYVAGVEVEFSIISSSPNVVYLQSAPPVGAEVLIRRIMPKSVPYSDFSRGNPFSQDALNKTNLQQLYIVQEIFDGYLPEGFFFRVNIDMRGMRIINLGYGINEGDAVNKKQLDVEHDKNTEQDSRLVILEDAITSSTVVNYVSQLYVATGGESVINTTNSLHAAALYIQGIFQHKAAGAYMQTGGVVTLAEPLIAGQEVYLILGSDLPEESLYPSLDSFIALQALVSGLNVNLTSLTSRLTTVEGNYAKKGANTDITSLGGLTTALPVSSGGTGGTTPASARNGISAAVVGSNNDITSLTNLTGGITGTVAGTAAASGIVGQLLESTGTGVALTTATDASVVSLSLPAGEWDVFGVIQYVSTGNMNGYKAGTTTSNSTYGTFNTTTQSAVAFNASATLVRETPTQRLRLSAPATLYLRANASFSSGGVTATGYLRAHRVR